MVDWGVISHPNTYLIPSSVCGIQLFRLSKRKKTYLYGMQQLSKQVKGNTYYDLGITVREEQKVKKKVDVFGQPK